MNAYSFLYLLTFEVVLTLGLIVFFKSPKNKINRLFLVLCILQSYTIFSDIGLQATSDYNKALFWMKTGLFWSFLMPYMLHFSLYFTEKNTAFVKKYIIPSIYLPAAVLTILLITDFIVIRPVKLEEGWNLLAFSNAWLFYVFLSVLILEVLVSVSLYWHFYSTTLEKRKKIQVRLILTGFFIMVLTGVVTNGILQSMNIRLPNMNSIATMVHSIFVAYAVWKYELFTLSPESAAEMIISAISDSLIVIRKDGLINITNKAVRDLTAYNKEEIESKNISDIIFDGQIPLTGSLLYSILDSGPLTDREVLIRCKNGDTVPISLSASLIKTNTYTIQGIILIGRDITERKRAERQLRVTKDELAKALEKEKELNEMKSRFVSNVSHEYRTPMTVILASTYLLEIFYEKRLKEDFLKHIGMIQNAVKSMTQLLENVLTLGRSDAGKIKLRPARINITELVNEVIEEIKLIDNNNHEILFTGIKDKVYIISDANLLRLILNNLLSNAVKYSPKESQVWINLDSKDEIMRISVTDKGCGIAEDDLKKLFEPFYRGDNIQAVPGTGLGLAIVKRGVDLLKGDISVRSTVNKGTTFTLRIGSLN